MGLYSSGGGYIFPVEHQCFRCHKLSTAVPIMLTNHDWGLCHVCIQDFYDVMLLETSPPKPKDPFAVYYTPRDIVEYLDKFIVGQLAAKKTLALAAYQNYKLQGDRSSKKPSKANVLMLGPTGSGKTAMIEHLADFLGVPFIIHDSTQMTETGYVGGDVDDMIAALYAMADEDLGKAQHGIIVLDEIDKIHCKADGSRDITGAAVQRSLLKTLESNIIHFSPTGQKTAAKIPFDTTNVLFIATGAFSDLPKIISRRVNKDKSGMGFAAKVRAPDDKVLFDDVIGELDTDDLIEYGFIPEFVGRFTNITHTDSLTKDVMKRILKEPKNSVLRQMTRLFELDGVELILTDVAQDYVSELAFKHKTGARALRGILSGLLKEAMFEYPSNSDILTVKLDIVDDKPVISMRDRDDEEVHYRIRENEDLTEEQREALYTAEENEPAGDDAEFDDPSFLSLEKG